MKAVVTIIVLILVGLGAFMYFSPGQVNAPEELDGEGAEMIEGSDKLAIELGTYEVNAEESMVNWSGKKPLIEGYVNSGTLMITGGSVEFSEASSTGSFDMDMNTLTVSETKAKPGAESALEEHLKGEGWFNVAEHPTASFEITNIVAAPTEEDEFLYEITGILTMNGESGELTFPASVYQNADGQLVAEAQTEFDRTQWGITAGSGSFFDNLADNVIDDMVGLSFTLVAERVGDEVIEEGSGMMVPGEEGEDLIVEEETGDAADEASTEE